MSFKVGKFSCIVLTISSTEMGVMKVERVSLVSSTSVFCGPLTLLRFFPGINLLSEVNGVALACCGVALVVLVAFSDGHGGLLEYQSRSIGCHLPPTFIHSP